MCNVGVNLYIFVFRGVELARVRRIAKSASVYTYMIKWSY